MMALSSGKPNTENKWLNSDLLKVDFSTVSHLEIANLNLENKYLGKDIDVSGCAYKNAKDMYTSTFIKRDQFLSNISSGKGLFSHTEKRVCAAATVPKHEKVPQCAKWALYEHFRTMDLDFSLHIKLPTDPLRSQKELNFHMETTRKAIDTADLELSLIQYTLCSLTGGALVKNIESRTNYFLLIRQCSIDNPEYIFKLALFSRIELNIRSTTNFLLAAGCFLKACRPYVSKYFSTCVGLPSDWIEVAEMYRSICLSENIEPHLPTVLRRCMISKFLDFDDYQLAKHNKEKSIIKRFRALKGKEKVSKSCFKLVPYTLKQLIRILHINQPSFTVMCILGKRYPSDSMEFIRLGLQGDWDSTKAGTRMKLPVPFTWETELSANGNTGETWMNLLQSGKLPYMALLRNLRNLITFFGYSELHELAVKKLTDQRAIINSKQFPFRYLAAFEAIKADRQLAMSRKRVRNKAVKKRASTGVKGASSPHLRKMYSTALCRAICTSVHYSIPPIRGSTLIVCSLAALESTGSKQLSAVGLGNDFRAIGLLLGSICIPLCESFEFYLLDLEHIRACSVNQVMFDGIFHEVTTSDILGWSSRMYDYAESEANCEFNAVLDEIYTSRRRIDNLLLIGKMVPALTGFVKNYRTYIRPLNAIWSNIAPQQSKEDMNEVSKDWVVLNGCTDQVLRYVAESSNENLLKHVRDIDHIHGLDRNPPARLRHRNSDQPKTVDIPLFEWRICRVFISSTFRDMHAERDIICGRVLPTLKEYAIRELRVHIFEIDLRWGVPEPATRNSQALQMCIEQAANADIFVLLVGDRYGWVPKPRLINALPKTLLDRLNKFYLPGMSITEIEYNMAKQSMFARLPVSNAQKAIEPSEELQKIQSQLLVFARDVSSLRNIPQSFHSDFVESRAEGRARLNAFKNVLHKDGVLVMSKYPANFNGEIANKPVMGNLTKLGNELLRSLQNSLCYLYKSIPNDADISLELPLRSVDRDTFVQVYLKPVAKAISPRQLSDLMRAFVSLEERGRQCHVARSQAAETVTAFHPKRKCKTVDDSHQSRLKSKGADGGLLLIFGAPGSGKTTHVAALATQVHCPNFMSSLKVKSDVTKKTFHSTGESIRFNSIPEKRFLVCTHMTNGLGLTGLPPKSEVVAVLDGWNKCLLVDAEEFSTVSTEAKKLFDEITLLFDDTQSSKNNHDGLLRSKLLCFTKLLQFSALYTGIYYAFFVDDVDRLQPPVLDWIPVVIPQNIRFILSCDSKSNMTAELASRPDCLGFPISPLTMAERTAAVRTYLGRYGKILKESSVGSQLSLLVNKNDADIPLYLQLACEQLRLYGTYEELDWQLKTLPTTIPRLVEHVIARVESECGSKLTMMALSLLVHARQPLSSAELHAMLNTWIKGSHKKEEKVDDYDYNSWYELACNAVSLEASCEDDEHEMMETLQGRSCPLPEYNRTRRVHLPALVFQILLSGIRPLLLGLDENIDESDLKESFSESSDSSPSLSFAQPGWLRFRSHEVAKTVKEMCLRVSHVPSYSNLGYGKQCNTTLGSTTGSHQDLRLIHWMLAGHVQNLEHKVYYFYHAGEPKMVCRLLTSLSFLKETIASGHGSSLMEDYHTYSSMYSSQQVEHKHIKDCKMDANDLQRLKSMQQFICSNLADIVKHPFLIGELACNYEADGWIRMLGRVHLKLTRKHTGHIRFFLRPNQEASDGPQHRPMVALTAIHKPVATIGSSAEIPSAVTVSETGRLMAYGTQTGVVHLVDILSMRVLSSYYGHSSEVLSLCFAAVKSISTAGLPAEQDEGSDGHLWLVSTAKDGSIFIWDASGLLGAANPYLSVIGRRIASLNNCHFRSVSTCAWHPFRCYLATGSLDGSVALWFFPKSPYQLKSFQTSANLTSTKAGIRYKKFKTNYSPVASVAFRLPLPSASDTKGANEQSYPTDIVAAGCWNGFVILYDMELEKVFLKLRVSPVSIAAVSFSPNGGSMLAVQDIRGQLVLYSTQPVAVLSIVTGNHLSHLDTMLVGPSLEDSQSGFVCFSRPHGKYIIQSGAFGAVSGRLNIWNAQLGSYQGSWHSSSAWSATDRDVTACVADPFGQVLFVGTNHGVVSAVSTRTGSVISSNIHCEGSRVQAMSCTLYDQRKAKQGYFVVLSVGYASGKGQIILCELPVIPDEVTTNQSERTSKPQSTSHVQTASVLVHYTLTDHWTGSDGHAGGTLCMGMYGSVLASGGGNAVCAVHYCHFDFKKEQVEFNDSCHHLMDCTSAVTAVSVHEDLLATGTKDRMVFIYKTKPRSKAKPVKLQQIYQAVFDWVTALCWMPIPVAHLRYCPEGVDRYTKKLFVASRDRTVCHYIFHKKLKKVGEKGVLCEDSIITTMSTKGSLLVAGSDEGQADVWILCNKSELLRLTSLDMAKNLGFDRLPEKPAGLLTVSLFEEFPDHQSDDEDDDDDASSTSSYRSCSTSEWSYFSGSEDFDSEDEVSVVSSILSKYDTHIFLFPSTRDFRFPKTHPKLLIGQSIPMSSTKMEFRFRSFIPSLPQLHTSFLGHPGITAAGLATGGLSNADADTVLVSATGSGSMQSDNPVCDIRLWRLSNFEEPLCHAPVQHDGPVTCLSVLGPDWIVSVGVDEKLIFWRRRYFEDETDNKSVFVVDLSSWLVRKWTGKSSDTGACMAVISCMKCMETIRMSKRKFLLCLAAGQEILFLTLEESALHSFLNHKNGGSYTLTDFKELHDVLVTDVAMKNIVVDLVVKTEDDGTLQFWADLIDGFSAAFSFSSDFGIFYNISPNATYSGTVQAPWRSCLHLVESNIVGIIPGVSAFKALMPSEESSLDQQKVEPFLENFKPTQLQALCVSDEKGSSEWFYLLTGRHNGLTYLTLTNHLGHDVVKVEMPSSTVSLTTTHAFMATDEKEKIRKLYILFASTDGYLRLAVSNIEPLLTSQPRCQVIRQTGLYPLGDRVTKILPLISDPPQIALGTRGGRIHVFSIV